MTGPCQSAICTNGEYESVKRLHKVDDNGVARYERRKLTNNTYAYWHPSGKGSDGTIVIDLHGHDIVQLFPNGRIQFRLAGYGTSTTRNRVSQFIPYPFGPISQRQYRQYLHTPDGPVEINDSDWYSIEDGVVRDVRTGDRITW
jgi:hypothetical protein